MDVLNGILKHGVHTMPFAVRFRWRLTLPQSTRSDYRIAAIIL